MKEEKMYKLLGFESMVFVDKYGSTLSVHPLPQLVEFECEEKPKETKGENNESH